MFVVKGFDLIRCAFKAFGIIERGIIIEADSFHLILESLGVLAAL